MPAQRDLTAWKEAEGDHADDTTYQRVHQDPRKTPTDEQRTTEEIKKASKKK